MSTILARSIREVIDAPLVFTYHTKFDVDVAKLIRGKLLQESALYLLAYNISACDEVWVVKLCIRDSDKCVQSFSCTAPRLGRSAGSVCQPLSARRLQKAQMCIRDSNII